MLSPKNPWALHSRRRTVHSSALDPRHRHTLLSLNSVNRGSYGDGKAAVPRGRVRLFRCYLQYIHASRNPRSAFRLLERVLLATALSLWRRAHFWTWWSEQ